MATPVPFPDVSSSKAIKACVQEPIDPLYFKQTSFIFSIEFSDTADAIFVEPWLDCKAWVLLKRNYTIKFMLIKCLFIYSIKIPSTEEELSYSLNLID